MSSRPFARARVTPGGEYDIASWSTSRALAAAALPGQASATSGTGVGSGALTVRDPDTGGKPWAMSDNLKPGNAVTIDATHDIGTESSRVATGVVRQVSAPGVLSPERTLSIEDDLGRLQRPAWVGVGYRRPQIAIDAAYLIDCAARSGGHYATPPPIASTRLSVPFCGTVEPEIGTLPFTLQNATWETINGSALLYIDSDSARLVYEFEPVSTSQLGTVNIAFTNVRRSPGPGPGLIPANMELRTESGDPVVWLRMGTTLEVSRNGTNWTILNPGGSSGIYEKRINVEIRYMTATTIQVRARSTPIHGPLAGVLSDWTTVVELTGPSFPMDSWTRLAIGRYLLGVQVGPEMQPMTPPTAVIGASGNRIFSPVLPQKIASWDLAQEIAKTSASALWIDEDGRVVYRPRADTLAATPVETVISIDSLEDIPWDQSRDDVADRLELTYIPVSQSGSFGTDEWAQPVWEATEPVYLPAGSTQVFEHDLDTTVIGSLAAWAQFETGSETDLSRYVASDQPKDGTKQPPSATTITSELLNPRRIRLTITNNESVDLWLAMGNGNPALVVRADVVALASEPVTIERGLSAEDATMPVQIDCGAYVQYEHDANALADDLYAAATTSPLTLDVRVVPRASRRLGSVITLNDPVTKVTARCLIVGIKNSGGPGNFVQTLTLAVLDFSEV